MEVPRSDGRVWSILRLRGGARADLNLTDAARCLDFTAEELRAGLVQLATRGILTVAENIKAPGFFIAESAHPEIAESAYCPEDYFLAIQSIHAAQKPGVEFI